MENQEQQKSAISIKSSKTKIIIYMLIGVAILGIGALAIYFQQGQNLTGFSSYEMMVSKNSPLTKNTTMAVRMPRVGDTSLRPSPVSVKVQISNLQISTPEISPNDDLSDDETAIAFDINTEAATSVYIANNNLTVKKLLPDQTPLKKGSYVYNWNGKDESSQVLPNGKYDLIVQVNNLTSNDFAKITITVLNPGPKISNFHVDQDTFSPDNDGMNDTTEIIFDLDQKANNRIVIKDAQDNEVKNFDVITKDPNVGGQYTWYGKDNQENELPDGEYRIFLTSQNANGNDAQDAKVTVKKLKLNE